MKALSIKQPWASLIVSGAKDIENRDWRTNYRGLVAIHASAKLDQREMGDACCFMEGFIPRFSADVFRTEHFPLGAILGVAEITDCVEQSTSPWFVGDWGFVFANAVRFTNPVPCRGALSFWDIPADILAAMRVEYREASK